MPFIRFTVSKYYTYIVTLILLFSKIIFTYSYCAEKGLIYIIIAALSSRQPSFYFKYTKLNMRSFCNINSVFKN
jgi:hypothetical protein